MSTSRFHRFPRYYLNNSTFPKRLFRQTTILGKLHFFIPQISKLLHIKIIRKVTCLCFIMNFLEKENSDHTSRLTTVISNIFKLSTRLLIVPSIQYRQQFVDSSKHQNIQIKQLDSQVSYDFIEYANVTLKRGGGDFKIV